METGKSNISKENKNILVISASPFPSYQGTQVAISLIITQLLSQGYSVDFLSYSFGIGKDISHSRYNHFVCADTKNYRKMRSGFDLIKPCIDILLLKKALELVKKNDYVSVHAHNYEALFLGLYLKKYCKIHLVYYAHNLMQSELPYYYHHRFQSLFIKFGKYLDGFVEKADSVICLSENLYQYFHQLGLKSVKKLSLSQKDLPNHHQITFSKKQTRTAFSLPREKELVGYCGNLDRYQNLDWFYTWLKENNNRALLIVSHENSFVFQREYPYLAKLPFCLYRMVNTLEETRIYMQACDYSIIPRKELYGIPIKKLNLESWNIKVKTPNLF